MATGGVAFRGAPQRRNSFSGLYRTLTMDPADLGDFIRRTATLTSTPGDQEAPLTARAKRIRRVVTVRTFLLLVGILIVLLMCVIPLADAIRLLQEPTFVFFMGRGWPQLMIVACVSSVVGYGVIIMTFFKYSKVEYKTEQTIMMIGMIVCTALGLSLLCISQPLSQRTLAIYTDLFFHCDLGLQTQRLYEYAMILQMMRARPECAVMRSVRNCSGYEDNKYTQYLQMLETRYKCSGFCSNAHQVIVGNQTQFTNRNVTVNGSEAVVALHQQQQPNRGQLAIALHGLANRRSLQRLSNRGAGELSVEHRDLVVRDVERENQLLMAEDVAEQDITRSRSASLDAYQPGVLDNYPPTLFSKANYKISCEGQAARALKYEALDVSRVLYIEGLALLFITVAISMVKLAGLWDSRWYNSGANGPRKPKEVIL